MIANIFASLQNLNKTQNVTCWTINVVYNHIKLSK